MIYKKAIIVLFIVLIAHILLSFFQINVLKSEIIILKSENEKLSGALAEMLDGMQSIFSESEAKDLVLDSFDKLKQEIVLEKDNQDKEETVSDIVTQWADKVVRLDCNFRKEDGSTSETNGSAVLTSIDNIPHIVTNKHVLIKEDRDLISCDFESSGIMQEIKPENIISIPGTDTLDLAYVRLKNQVSIDKLNVCQDRSLLGDKIITLGYPEVGSTDGITVTEGIISGFDGSYYVTSAKIERGNSGGAAIDVKRNCFIGIPTLVIAGKIESLARILPL